MIWQSLNQVPRVKRPPEKGLRLGSSPPKRTVAGVPFKLVPVVTRGGTEPRLSHHSKYSALAQNRRGVPPATQGLPSSGTGTVCWTPVGAGVSKPAGRTDDDGAPLLVPRASTGVGRACCVVFSIFSRENTGGKRYAQRGDSESSRGCCAASSGKQMPEITKPAKRIRECFMVSAYWLIVLMILR